MAKGTGLALRAVEVGGGIVSRIKVKGRAIDKREKLIVDGKRIIEGELALVRLMKKLDHHRDLHGARGVECDIGLVGPLRFTAQEAEENSDIGGRGKDASLDLTFGAGQ